MATSDQPEPSATPSPPPAAGSSRGSSAASSGPFLTDPGAGFDPDTPPPEPTAAAEPDHLELVVWDTERMARSLRAQGAITHALVGAKDAYGRRPAQDWLWQDHEIAAAAPAFAALANRFPASRAAAAVSDELGAGAALITYATRSLQEAAAVRRARDQVEPEPVTGVPADTPHPGTFEPDGFSDMEWLRGAAAASPDAAAADAAAVHVEPGPIARNGRGQRVRADGEQPLPPDLQITQPDPGGPPDE